jgi:NADH dehydrogenase FAD-containing subunit
VGGRYSRDEISFPIRELVERGGGVFRKGWAEQIDPVNRIVSLASGEEISYDVVSFNVGSSVPFEKLVPPEERDALGTSIFPAKPVACLDMARLRLTSLEPPRTIAVVGGGPGGIELAANTAWSIRERGIDAKVTLFAASRLTPRQNEKFRGKAHRRLRSLGVEVREHSPVERVDAQTLLSQGKEYPSEMSLLAIGVEPPPIFRRSGLATGPSGGLLVDRYLRSPEYPEIFGGGDCIEIDGRPLARVGVYALRQTEHLEQNIAATLFGGELSPFRTGEEYLLICNLAGGHGVATKYGLVAEGRLPGAVKHAIDRWFVSSHAP